MVDSGSVGRSLVALLGTALAAAVGVGLFVAVPLYTDVGVVEVLLAVLVFAGGAALAGRIASNLFPGYNVAEVEVSGPITREGDGPGPLPTGSGASADDLVEQIERADADGNAQALVVKLNTPGGAVVPSEDIREAAADFDGPTVAYAEDMAASGGYWIASGCDEFHARESSVVGSIGVTYAHLGRSELAKMLGLDYRRLVAGEYKDAGAAWREMTDDEFDYWQGLIDDQYDMFVDTVAEGRDLDPEFVRDTEARVYLGREAGETGLVDTVGPREEMEDRLADRIGVADITVEEFEPQHGIQGRIGAGARSVAHSFGAGVASVFADEEGELSLRV